MRIRKKLIIFVGLVAACSALYVYLSSKRKSPNGQVEENPVIPNVVIITFQSIRPEEGLEDPSHQYIPRIWNDILPAGTLYPNAGPARITFHESQVNEIWTGTAYYSLHTLVTHTIFHLVGTKYGF